MTAAIRTRSRASSPWVRAVPVTTKTQQAQASNPAASTRVSGRLELRCRPTKRTSAPRSGTTRISRDASIRGMSRPAMSAVGMLPSEVAAITIPDMLGDNPRISRRTEATGTHSIVSNDTVSTAAETCRRSLPSKGTRNHDRPRRPRGRGRD